jgi:hypothetical protein
MPKQSLIKMEQEDDDCNSEEFDIDNKIEELDQELLSGLHDDDDGTAGTTAMTTKWRQQRRH